MGWTEHFSLQIIRGITAFAYICVVIISFVTMFDSFADFLLQIFIDIIAGLMFCIYVLRLPQALAFVERVQAGKFLRTFTGRAVVDLILVFILLIENGTPALIVEFVLGAQIFVLWRITIEEPEKGNMIFFTSDYQYVEDVNAQQPQQQAGYNTNQSGFGGGGGYPAVIGVNNLAQPTNYTMEPTSYTIEEPYTAQPTMVDFGDKASGPTISSV